ncbi:MAG: pantoate--beta-alanine ligase [Chlorobi bacterium]|nr:pantoate--beta-alanine ligase [Chlorobiota bacterium]
MKMIRTIDELKRWRESLDGPLGFVPTMGALHEGHFSLVRCSKQENPYTIVSIFVNPTQFDDPEDLRKYPRTFERDKELLEREGVDAVFAPTVEEMYPKGFEDEDAHYDFGYLERILEGAHRPGHFKGVAQVVAKLLRAVEPDVLYLGQKDYQQVLIIKKLIEKLSMPIKVVMCPTVRESDGLAMSSRNVRLSPQQRENALALYRSLIKAKEVYEQGGSVVEAKQEAMKILESAPLIKEIDYFEIVDADTLKPINNWDEADKVIALVAVRMEGVRLIDNMFIK